MGFGSTALSSDKLISENVVFFKWAIWGLFSVYFSGLFKREYTFYNK